MTLPLDLQFHFLDHFAVRGGVPVSIRPLPVEGHTHTTFSDGRDDPAVCAEAAVESGLQTLVYTEHIRADAPWVDPYFDEIERLRDEYRGRLDIRVGAEISVLDPGGLIDADDRILARSEIIIGSVHTLPPRGDSFADIFQKTTAEEILAGETEYLFGLLQNPAVHIIGHPFGQHLDLFGLPPADLLTKFLHAAADAGKAVEITLKYRGVEFFLHTAAALNRDFLFWPGSDAHFARDIGRWFRAFRPEKQRENSK